MDPLRVFDLTTAAGAARVLAFVLARHADDDGVVSTVTRDQLMSEARLTKSGFQFAMRALRDGGEVDYVPGLGRTRSIYRLHVGGSK